MEIVRTVNVARPVPQVFAYLSDFTTTTEWDPGTVRTTREAGSGGVGTRYRNVSTFMGRQTELTYVVTEHQPPSRLALRGENKTVRADDTMTLEPTADNGTKVTYRAVFTFKGAARLVAPFTAPAFRRLGDKAADGLRTALGGAGS
jgi:uncharacterized protein YndB with AHSA1/START domain